MLEKISGHPIDKESQKRWLEEEAKRERMNRVDSATLIINRKIREHGEMSFEDIVEAIEGEGISMREYNNNPDSEFPTFRIIDKEQPRYNR